MYLTLMKIMKINFFTMYAGNWSAISNKCFENNHNIQSYLINL